jgi:hypothetical protein
VLCLGDANDEIISQLRCLNHGENQKAAERERDVRVCNLYVLDFDHPVDFFFFFPVCMLMVYSLLYTNLQGSAALLL